MFLHRDFFLTTDTARRLFHEVAAPLPIVDFHSHLSADDLATDRRFENLDAAWLDGDHYKWRAMRSVGVPEESITGAVSPFQRFQKWAKTVPYLLRNPLYHWTHLELRRYFGIDQLLDGASAAKVFDVAGDLLRSAGYSSRELLRRKNVTLVCTTDDPVDDLTSHRKLSEDGYGVRVLPTFRPDRALDAGNPVRMNAWINQLAETTNRDITSWALFLEALDERHQFFHDHGCRLADHGLTSLGSASFSSQNAASSFDSLRAGKTIAFANQQEFITAVLFHLAKMNHARGWTQQFHLGALRNPVTRRFQTLGPDAGFDTIGDPVSITSVARFLDLLDRDHALARTILYNLNPSDNAAFVSLGGSFQNGPGRGPVRWGPAWWFLDQEDGIRDHLNVISRLGLLRKFPGMTTDSRSLLSFPRHEYFRRILCDEIGKEVEAGLLPDEPALLDPLVSDVCYNNAASLFPGVIPPTGLGQEA